MPRFAFLPFRQLNANTFDLVNKMKFIFRIISIMICFLMMFPLLCGCGNSSGSESTSQSASEVEPNDDKKIDLNLFTSPSLEDRPMVMMHSASTGLIDDVYARGYGGIVTNVAWSNDYLQNARSWSSLANNVGYAIGKGMHVWLYDEYGYPSGSAFGQTLKGNSEYEALGLVAQYKTVNKGETARIDLLYGHTAIVSAYVYDGSGQADMDLSSFENANSGISVDGSYVTYTNRTESSKVLVAYMSKPWYENTHSMENWYAQQRYINMLDEKPTSKFINLTHEQYYETLGEYFGNGIQAFFTDEPALQGNYFDISERNRIVIDEPDPNVPIVECLNYSDTLYEKFERAYGYKLQPYLGYLYNDDSSVKAKQVRMDFYALTSNLFENNYLGQIESWCESKNVKSSGHLLLEETLYQNPWFSGNMIQLLSRMGIPGSDLLYSKAQTAINASCVVSKMAAAAAEFTGKTDTFAEISGAFDGTIGDIYDQINAVGAQVCMGINNFSSYYYQGGNHTLDEDKLFSTAIGRMRYMTTGVNHCAKVAVYYPYEGVSAETLPSLSMWSPTERAKSISDSFGDICRTLVGKQVDYDLVDYSNLAKCTVSDGALVSPNGERFTAVVVPYTTAMRSEAVLKFIEASNAGVKIILNDFEEIVCESGKNSVAERFSEIAGKAEIVTSSNGAANYLKRNGYSYATLDDDAYNVFISKRENANYSVFTVVNAYESDKSYNFKLEANGTKVSYYNSLTGKVTDISATSRNGIATFDFTLSANTTGFFVVS